MPRQQSDESTKINFDEKNNVFDKTDKFKKKTTIEYGKNVFYANNRKEINNSLLTQKNQNKNNQISL